MNKHTRYLEYFEPYRLYAKGAFCKVNYTPPQIYVWLLHSYWLGVLLRIPFAMMEHATRAQIVQFSPHIPLTTQDTGVLRDLFGNSQNAGFINYREKNL